MNILVQLISHVFNVLLRKLHKNLVKIIGNQSHETRAREIDFAKIVCVYKCVCVSKKGECGSFQTERALSDNDMHI